MATNKFNKVMPYLRWNAVREHGGGATDSTLLEQYVTGQDEASFEELLHRHGPMVLGVCRRVLSNEADVEDAFQATFLVFVRKAASIRSRSTVSNWLYGVAHNTALKAKEMNRKRLAKEREAGERPRPEAAECDARELQAQLDAELSRLPDRYRAAIVLCDLEGKTIQQAALHLSVPHGTVASRLTRGRALLRKRLQQRGLAVSGAALVAACSHGMLNASVPTNLMLTTVKATRRFAAGQTVGAGALPAAVAALTEGVLKTMLRNKLKAATVIVLAVVVLGLGGTAYCMLAADPPEGTKEPIKPPSAATTELQTRNDAKSGAKSDEKGNERINLPKSRALEQVLVTLDKDGKIIVTVPIARSYSYEYKDLTILDTQGKKVEKEALAKLIKGETVAMSADHGLAVDPLHLRVLKEGTLVFVLPPPVPGAQFAPGGTVVGAAPEGAPWIDYHKLDLPKTRPLEQVLVTPEKDGKIVVKVAVTGFFRSEAVYPGGDSQGVELRTMVRSKTFNLADVRVLDTKGKKLDSTTIAKLLKGETVALAAIHDREVDPLHLRVLKEGTLVFILPEDKN
jgi:RNA polymerase sigma factor (sigma-70 family)